MSTDSELLSYTFDKLSYLPFHYVLVSGNDIVRKNHHGSFVVHPLDQQSVTSISNDKNKTHVFCTLKVSFSE
jgi:hypothetical protein